MATQSPFSLLDGLLQRLSPTSLVPQWLVDESQHRLVLLLNHVLMQEEAAMERLVQQKGRVLLVQWRQFQLGLRVTPAGLFELAPEQTTPDLRIEVIETSPLGLAQGAMRGERPAIRIDGDVQFAGEIQWLADNVRWDVEEDLSRIIGDVPAHTLAQAARSFLDMLRKFVGGRGEQVSQ